MKNIRSILTMTLFSFVLSSNLAASNTSIEPGKIWKTDLTEYIQAINFDDVSDIPEMLYVDFKIDKEGKLIIMSASQDQLEMMLKEKLNNKEIHQGDLKTNKKYRLPIRFKK